MRVVLRKASTRGFFACVLVVGICLAVAPSNYESTVYLGNYPRYKHPGWQEAVNGITQDDRAYWYITQVRRLWRIPISHDLESPVSCSDPGVSCVSINPFDQIFGTPIVWDLIEHSYDHFGDLDYVEHDGESYLFIPLEGTTDSGDPPSAVAVFRANATLDFVTLAAPPTPPNDSHGAFAAFDPADHLYLQQGAAPEAFKDDPRGAPRKLFKFTIDWDLLRDQGRLSTAASRCFGGPDNGQECSDESGCGEPAVCLQPLPEPSEVTTLDEEGFPIGLYFEQGADFSDDGRLLFIVNGSDKTDCHCGIHAFDVVLEGTSDSPCHTGDGSCVATRVDRSSKTGSGFRFQYNPGYNATDSFEEPEGLTWWDLDAAADAGLTIPGTTSAGGPVRGQLHALLLDNDYAPFDDDEVWIKHYRVSQAPVVDAARIRVIPPTLDFDEVPVAGAAALPVTVANQSADTDLHVTGLGLASGTSPSFEIASMPDLPAVLAPGAEIALEISFSPTIEGAATGSLEITSDDLDDPLVSVPLTGFGIGFEEQARRLEEGYEDALATGALYGIGSGNSAANRANSLRNMLLAAEGYLELGLIAETCDQLEQVARRMDGEPRPGDFVAGPAGAGLVEGIEAFRARLGCQ